MHTSGLLLARSGRYAFMATMLVPKLTLPRMANSAQTTHTDDVEVNKRKLEVLMEPIAAKVNSRGLRCDAVQVQAGERVSTCDGARWSAIAPTEMTVSACSATDAENT